MDSQVTLCLACSSSLPPIRSPQSDSVSKHGTVFITHCCNRPICPSCVSSNPRLTRYDPCLVCLGGVAVVDRNIRVDQGDHQIPASNVDGAVRDEDTFILGDDDDDEDYEPQAECLDLYASPSTTSVSHDQLTNKDPVSEHRSEEKNTISPRMVTISPTIPARYHIKHKDTLQGLALRFRVEGRELCRLNNLPSSTLTTTPHLLHTRTSIALPPSAQTKLEDHNNDEETESRRARERAEKRLQMLTKEVDWRVAKVYVALADDPEEVAEYEMKRKEDYDSSKFTTTTISGQSTLEMMAIDRYLDDNEWEEREMRSGRGVRIPRLVNSEKGWNW